MLINTLNTNPTVGQPITIKLVSGEEVIGKVAEVTADHLFLSKPCVVFINTANGQLAMQNVVLTADHQKPVQFNRAAIVAYAAPNKEISDQYMSALSGIIKPPTGVSF